MDASTDSKAASGGKPAVTFVENYNGYWVSTSDRKVRNFFWENTMIAGPSATS